MTNLFSFKTNIKYDTIPIKFRKNKTRNIYIGNKILPEIGLLLSKYQIGKTIVIITNSKINSLYAKPLIQSLKKANYKIHILEIPDGEQYKNLNTITNLLTGLANHQLERTDTVIALGGGIIGDLAGFTASIYLRGINFIQIPTTLLAQVDSSVGGKTGANLTQGKNLVGTFYQPLFTYIDLETIFTLPQKEIRCGLAEIVKYGFIHDKKLLKYIEQNISKIKHQNTYTSDPIIWKYLITQSCHNKAWVVAQDEKEQNLRQILNFGHTVGHAIESVFEYKKYTHGEAVALGIKTAFNISLIQKLITQSYYESSIKLLESLGFILTIPNIPTDKIMQKLYSDKKIKNGHLTFILPTAPSRVQIKTNIPLSVIKTSIANLA